MEDKSTVGMMTCWICGEGAQIIVKTDLKPTLPRNCGSLPNIYCSDCEGKAKEKDGVWLISVRDGDVPKDEELYNPHRTGDVVLIKKSAFREKILPLISEDTVRNQMAEMVESSIYFYLEDSAWDAFQLPRGPKNDK